MKETSQSQDTTRRPGTAAQQVVVYGKTDGPGRHQAWEKKSDSPGSRRLHDVAAERSDTLCCVLLMNWPYVASADE